MQANEWALILAMLAVTFVARYPVLALVGRVRVPRPLNDALQFVPVAVLSAIIVPGALRPRGDWALSWANPYLMASVVAVLVSARTKNFLATVVSGMAAFFICRLCFG